MLGGRQPSGSTIIAGGKYQPSKKAHRDGGLRGRDVMPRVKIIWTESLRLDEYETREICRLIEPGEFEEITDEELQGLRRNLHSLPRPSYGFEPRILLLDTETFSTRMDTIRKLVEKQKIAQEVEAKRREEAAKKRKMTLLQRKKIQLEKLKKELGE